MVSVGYRGTRDLIFQVGNLLMAAEHQATPDTWRTTPEDGATRPGPVLSEFVTKESP
jgi:nitrogenase molybdenum-iron protein NifN